MGLRPLSRIEAMSDQQKKAPSPSDEQLDVIPMNKTSPGLVIGIVAGVLIVGGTLTFALRGKGKSAAQPRVETSVAAPETNDKEEAKKRLEHIAMTKRAMEAAEVKKKEQEAEEAAKKAAEEEEAAKPTPAGPQGPAPVTGAAAKKTASDLDSMSDDILSGLQ